MYRLTEKGKEYFDGQLEYAFEYMGRHKGYLTDFLRGKINLLSSIEEKGSLPASETYDYEFLESLFRRGMVEVV